MPTLSPQTTRNLTLLDELLINSFDPGEFLRMVDRVFGPSTTADLPPLADSPRSFMFHAVRVLARRGLLDDRFFSALTQERPRRADEIRQISSLMTQGLDADAIEVDTVVWRRSGEEQSRLDWVVLLEQHLLSRERIAADDDGHQELDATIDRLARRIRNCPMLTAGSVVAGTRIEKILGSGQFGTVWRARHLTNGQVVATKVFNLDRLTESIMLWRFRRSIHALRMLNSYRGTPVSIPPLIEVAEDTLSFVMPYFPQGTLEQVALRGWSLATKIAVFLDVCRAIEFAHKIGVIHRDIKPANVLLDETLRPVVIDYDIADIHFVTKLSIEQGGLGTPVFAAPEQLESAASTDERSDIYSLGRLLHYLLLERSPGSQLDRDPSLENLRGQTPSLVATIRRATQWDPQRRYRTVGELIKDVEKYHTGMAAFRARAAGASRWIRNHAALLAATASITTASLGVAATYQKIAAERKESLARIGAAEEQALGALAQMTVVDQRVSLLMNQFDTIETELVLLNDVVRPDCFDTDQRASLQWITLRMGQVVVAFDKIGAEIHDSTQTLLDQHTSIQQNLLDREDPEIEGPARVGRGDKVMMSAPSNGQLGESAEGVEGVTEPPAPPALLIEASPADVPDPIGGGDVNDPVLETEKLGVASGERNSHSRARREAYTNDSEDPGDRRLYSIANAIIDDLTKECATYALDPDRLRFMVHIKGDEVSFPGQVPNKYLAMCITSRLLNDKRTAVLTAGGLGVNLLVRFSTETPK